MNNSKKDIKKEEIYAKYKERYIIERKKLEKFLRNDEHLLLYFQKTANILADDVSRLIGGFCFGLPVLLISIIFSFILHSELIILILVDLIFAFITFYLITKGVRNYRRKGRQFEVSKEELRELIETSFITNKRWIQKTYTNLKLSLSLYEKGILQKENDLFYINLTSIHLKYSINEIPRSIMTIIEIYLNQYQMNTIAVPLVKFKEVISKLKEYVEIKEKIYNKVSGAIYFHEKEK